MSVPGFVWALDQGRAQNLSPSERLVLIVLTDRGNSKRLCWPSLELLASDTGLVKRTILTVVHSLQRLGLIRIERNGRRSDYHILRPPDDHKQAQPLRRMGRKPAQPLHQSGKPNGATTAPEVIHKDATIAPDGAPDRRNSRQRSAQSTTKIGATIATETTKETEKETARATASLAAAVADAPAEASKVVDFQQQQKGRAPPSPHTPPNPSTNDATKGGGDPFADGGETKPYLRRLLGRPVHLAAAEPEVITDDDPPRTDADRARMAQQLASLTRNLARGLFTNYPPRTAERSPAEQIEQITNPLHPQDPVLTPEQQIAALMAAATADQIARAEAHGRPPMLEAAE